jgi:thiol-disulfide isomerase/thioredoxin
MLRRLCLIACLSGFIIGCGQTPAPAPVVGTIDGEVVDFNELRGQWVVLNYWASWCKPCYQEIPELNAFARQADNVVVLGVNFDQVPLYELKMLIRQLDIEFPTLAVNPGPQLGLPDIPGLPTTYILNPQGKLVNRLYGEQTRESLLAALN